MSSNSTNPELENFELVIDSAITNLKHPSIIQDASLVNTPELALTYFQYKNKGTDILPPVVRAISGDYKQVMIERPPQQVKIEYAPNFNSEDWMWDEKISYTIQLPWMLYILVFNAKTPGYSHLSKLFIYAHSSPVMAEDEILFVFPLPNTYMDGQVCIDKDQINETLADLHSDDLQSAISYILNCFWDSGFNQDAHGHLIDKYPTEYQDLFTEEETFGGLNYDQRHTKFLELLSKIDVEGILELGYQPAKLPSLIDDYYYNVKIPSPSICTVGDWIKVFESSKTNSYVEFPNPLLSFFKDLMQ